MIEFYPQVHALHVAAISLSGLWMLLRGLVLLAGMRWARGAAAWTVSLAIDGTVLTAAAMLLTMLPAEMFANHWLTAKLAFVAIYFAAGYAAFLAQRRRRWLALMLAVAMIAYGLAYGIARAHDMLGWWAVWGL
ncbi:MAG: SirB2 family protein [Alphaproteobacteria bacterium]|nr:SirB2 family protein [Alphaproteobacteria bacterium]MCB9930593.1 SirB2 family protein [Alphaproteobacteria bacterium]